MRLYVKKLYSLNPDKYKDILFMEAFQEYNKWIEELRNHQPLKYYWDWNIEKSFFNSYKTFDEWLDTEI